MVQTNNVIKKIIDCSVVLRRDPVISTQARAFTHYEASLQLTNVTSRGFTPLYDMQLHCSLEWGDSNADQDEKFSTVSCRIYLRSDIFIGPITLGIQYIFSSRQRTKRFSFTFLCPMFGASQQTFKWTVLWHGRMRGFWKLLWLLEPFSQRRRLIVHELHFAFITTSILFNDRLASWWTTRSFCPMLTEFYGAVHMKCTFRIP